MGGSYAGQPNPETTQQMLQSYLKYLPALSSETSNAIPQIANATLKSAQDTQPGYNQLNLDQLSRYALPEAQIGQQVSNSNAQAGAKTNLDQITGAGGQAAKAAMELNKATNPDYYKAQAAASQGSADAVNAIKLGGLSPGEAAAVERSTNQGNVGSGNLGNLNSTNTISNALNFGGAFNQKVGLMNNAVGAATGAANSASGNGGFSGVNIALGQPNMSSMGNFGTSQFGNANAATQSGSAGNAFNFGGSLLGNMTSSNNQALSSMTQNQIANSPASYLGATICCFIFLEAYHGDLPKRVRRARDIYYKMFPHIATGYKRTAKIIVPLMRNCPLFRELIWKTMVHPMSSRLNKGHVKSVRFWMNVWAFVGRLSWA